MSFSLDRGAQDRMIDVRCQGDNQETMTDIQDNIQARLTPES